MYYASGKRLNKLLFVHLLRNSTTPEGVNSIALPQFSLHPCMEEPSPSLGVPGNCAGPAPHYIYIGESPVHSFTICSCGAILYISIIFFKRTSEMVICLFLNLINVSVNCV